MFRMAWRAAWSGDLVRKVYRFMTERQPGITCVRSLPTRLIPLSNSGPAPMGERPTQLIVERQDTLDPGRQLKCVQTLWSSAAPNRLARDGQLIGRRLSLPPAGDKLTPSERERKVNPPGTVVREPSAEGQTRCPSADGDSIRKSLAIIQSPAAADLKTVPSESMIADANADGCCPSVKLCVQILRNTLWCNRLPVILFLGR